MMSATSAFPFDIPAHMRNAVHSSLSSSRHPHHGRKHTTLQHVENIKPSKGSPSAPALSVSVENVKNSLSSSSIYGSS